MLKTEDPTLKGILERARKTLPEMATHVDRSGMFTLLTAGAQMRMPFFHSFDPDMKLHRYDCSLKDGARTLQFAHQSREKLITAKRWEQLRIVIDRAMKALNPEERNAFEQFKKDHANEKIAQLLHEKAPEVSSGEFLALIDERWERVSARVTAEEGPD